MNAFKEPAAVETLLAIDRHIVDIKKQGEIVFNTLYVARPDGRPAVLSALDTIDSRSARTEADIRAIRRYALGIVTTAFIGLCGWLFNIITAAK